MTTQFRRVGTGGGISGNDAKVLDKLSYDEPTDTIIADSSLQVKPSTVYLGSAFGMSNAVQAVGFRLADGTDALCLVNRFDKDGGSYSNPRFFALGSSSTLNVNLVDNVVMQSPIPVSYTTAGDNLTYSFEIKPAGAGRLRAQYWLGEDDSGAPVVDFHRDITQAEVDANKPVLVEPNFYVLARNSKLFVRFTGVPLKGNGTQPWFRSKVLPFKEAQFSGHYEYVNALSPNTRPFIGGTYFADAAAGNVMMQIEETFRDTFRVVDYLENFIGTRYAQVDFTAFGQRPVRLVQAGDDVEFFRMKAGSDNEAWWYKNHRDGSIVRIPAGSTPYTTTPAPAPDSAVLRGMGVFPSSDLPVREMVLRNFRATVSVRTNLVVVHIYSQDGSRLRVSGTVSRNSGAPYIQDVSTNGSGMQVAILTTSDVLDQGKYIVSTVGASENHVTLEWLVQKNDSDEYVYFVKLE
ncbi:hypothetical protein [Vibrio cholerae]|uniref:hypothetical protein n=1 Tax=Vibrio cholerae TaxID=666 RepID=UPI0011582FB3|nr:hypothetical protein [Vibrio cholerae]TQQ41031.1 hypothetical protein FLL70_04610 [Vibrio cholerae]